MLLILITTIQKTNHTYTITSYCLFKWFSPVPFWCIVITDIVFQLIQDIKCIVQTDYVLIFDYHKPSVQSFVHYLQNSIQWKPFSNNHNNNNKNNSNSNMNTNPTPSNTADKPNDTRDIQPHSVPLILHNADDKLPFELKIVESILIHTVICISLFYKMDSFILRINC